MKTQVGIKDGIRDGPTPSGTTKATERYELNFVDGKLDGTATLWGADGKKIIQQYDDGKLVKESKE